VVLLRPACCCARLYIYTKYIRGLLNCKMRLSVEQNNLNSIRMHKLYIINGGKYAICIVSYTTRCLMHVRRSQCHRCICNPFSMHFVPWLPSLLEPCTPDSKPTCIRLENNLTNPCLLVEVLISLRDSNTLSKFHVSAYTCLSKQLALILCINAG
jgi:hypothetical protein